MGEPKHTPGRLAAGPMTTTRSDWAQLRSSEGNTIVSSGINVVAAVWGETDGQERTNAHRLALCWNMHNELVSGLQGMLDEWDKLSRYGSPLAKAANERVNFARAALARATSPDPDPHTEAPGGRTHSPETARS